MVKYFNLKFKAVRTLAGSTPGTEDGQGKNAKLRSPNGITFNPLDGCLYVCDYNNNMIRKVTQAGTDTIQYKKLFALF